MEVKARIGNGLDNKIRNLLLPSSNTISGSIFGKAPSWYTSSSIDENYLSYLVMLVADNSFQEHFGL